MSCAVASSPDAGASPDSGTLTVRVGDARLAIAAQMVAEVVRRPNITRVPNGPAALLGVTHLRGSVLPVISLQALLDGSAAPLPSTIDRLVVMRQDPPLALAVDSVETLAIGNGGAGLAGSPQIRHAASGRTLDLDAALRERFAVFRTRASAASRAAGTTAAVPRNERRFLTFAVDDQDYALPLEVVAEVVPLPSSLLALPMTEAVLHGLFTLRDTVLPVLSLRGLLGLPAVPLEGRSKAVLVRIGPRRVALAVDGLGQILAVPPDRITPAPRLFNLGGEARIASVLQREDGVGLVSVLDPARLMAEERVARLIAELEGEDRTVVAADQAGDRERFLVIRLGTESYGLPISRVDEVVRMPSTLTRLPRAPAYVLGVMNLRGRVLPVIDQRRRFALAPSAAPGRIVVVTLGNLQAGFAVDAVADMLEVGAEELLRTPTMTDDGDPVFDRAVTINRGDAMILLIDPAALLDRAEAALLKDLSAETPSP